MGQRLLDLVDRIDRVDRRAELAGHDLPGKPGIDLADLLRAAPREEAAQHEAGEPHATIDEIAAPDRGVLAAHRAVMHQGTSVATQSARRPVADPPIASRPSMIRASPVARATRWARSSPSTITRSAPSALSSSASSGRRTTFTVRRPR